MSGQWQRHTTQACISDCGRDETGRSVEPSTISPISSFPSSCLGTPLAFSISAERECDRNLSCILLGVGSVPKRELGNEAFRSERVRTIGCGLIAVWALLLCAGCGVGQTSGQRLANDQDAIERTSEKGPVKLVVRAAPREPRLSDLVELQIQVSAPVGVELKAPAFGQAVGEFVVRDYTERSDAKNKAANTATNQVRTFVYQLEPMHAGRHLIRALAIEFIDTRATSEQKGVTAFIESEPLEVNVTSELGDQVPNLADLEPMLPPRPLPATSRWGWWLLACTIIVAGALIYWLRRRKEIEVAEVRSLTPEEIAHAALVQLLAENLPEKQLFKEFYLRLTGIVRQYIEGSTGIRAPEQTTEEFLSAIRFRDLFTAERSLRLKDFLEAADMVKYAGQQPDQEQIALSIDRAHEFVAYRPAILSSAVAEIASTSPEATNNAGGSA